MELRFRTINQLLVNSSACETSNFKFFLKKEFDFTGTIVQDHDHYTTRPINFKSHRIILFETERTFLYNHDMHLSIIELKS